MKTCNYCKTTYFNSSDFHIYSDTCKICEKENKEIKQFLKTKKINLKK